MNIAKLKCLLNPRDEPEMNENEPYLINLNWKGQKECMRLRVKAESVLEALK